MCGRYSFTTPEEAARRVFRYGGPPLNLRPRYNVCPTDDVAAVRLSKQSGRELVMMRWGLIPYWATDKKIGYKTINARVESVATAPVFRAAFRQRRCLVLADGFYEWQTIGAGVKQPYRITMKDDEPFAFAGLWDSWKGPEARIVSCTIITGQPNGLVAEIHDRMPVILDPTDYDAWLAAKAGVDLLRPFPAEKMRAYRVSNRVNSPKNDDAEIIEGLNA